MESDIDKIRIDIPDLVVEVHADPVIVHHLDEFHGIVIGQKPAGFRIHVRLCPHPHRLGIQGYDPVSHILGHGLCFLSKQQIFILGPSDHIAGFHLGPSVLSGKNSSAAVLIQITDLVGILARLGPDIESVLNIRHRQLLFHSLFFIFKFLVDI